MSGGRQRETWEVVGDDDATHSFDVDVTIGKPFDVVTHKWTSLADVREYAAHLRATTERLYRGGSPLRTIADCPCCRAPTGTATVGARVYGVEYRRCVRCGHAFIREQPTEDALAALFAGSDEHSSTYTDEPGSERRLDEIVRPKLEWLRRVHADWRGRKPRSVLDVGAGGGHFLAVCGRDGLRAEGYEVSAPSRRFAQHAFGLDLRASDFRADQPGNERFDLVTFWGLLEYTADPSSFLRSAARWLDPDTGLLAVEVPRFDCLGTAVQRTAVEVARHLDPSSHVNCFSDASLCIALVRAGLRPVAAWYFGMDAFEMIVQLALRHNDASLVETAASLLPEIQAGVDAARWCDDIVIAAVPL